MHVHVGIEDDELRIDLMNQVRYFLPHLLMLSTSSPFAEGEDTGLKCYRLAAYHELPRTGLPRAFRELGRVPAHVDCWCATASSRTPPRSGGTCARPPASPRSRCA